MSYDDEVLADAPLSYWKLDEPSGLIAADEVGGLDLSWLLGAGITHVAGLGSGGALQFPDALTTIFSGLEYQYEFRGLLPFTLEFWVRFLAASTSSYLELGSVGADGYRFGIDPVNGYAALRSEFNGSITTFDNLTERRAYTVGPLHHFVMTFDGAVLSVIVDGKLRDHRDSAVAPAHSDGLSITGRNSVIDAPAVYDYAMSATRVRAHYYAGIGEVDSAVPLRTYDESVLADSPASFWKLDEISGLTAADAMGVADGAIGAGIVLGVAPAPLRIGGFAARLPAVNPVTLAAETIIVGDHYRLTSGSYSVDGWFCGDRDEDGSYGQILSGQFSDGWTYEIDGARYHDDDVQAEMCQWDCWEARGSAVDPAIRGWHHVAVTYDAIAQHAAIWLDGELFEEVDGDESALIAEGATGSFVLYLGSPLVGGWRQTQFDLSRIALYLHVLSPERIAAHYAGEPVPPPARAGLIHARRDGHGIGS